MERKTLFVLFILFLLFKIDTQNTYASQNASGSSAKMQTKLFVKEEDNRAKILRGFLEKHSSPLAPYSETFIKNSDEYRLDWRLVAAISGVESTFGKYIPYKSYNGWGWGIYGNNVIYFSSWEEGIETVSKGLRVNYINKWKATDVYEIGRIYAASPRWASNVNYFMKQITQFQYQNQVNNLSISL